MSKNVCGERLINGIVKENPTFVMMLGMCPTLAVTSSAMNGLGMGLSTTVVLILSNMLISALRKIIPDKVRIPASGSYFSFSCIPIFSKNSSTTPFIVKKSPSPYIPSVNCILSSGSSVRGRDFGRYTFPSSYSRTFLFLLL